MLTEDVIPNVWNPTTPSQTSHSYPMIACAAFFYDSFGMHNDTIEVMNA
jgi:hypothetical protein